MKNKTALEGFIEYLEWIKHRDNIPNYVITTAKNYLYAEKQQMIDFHIEVMKVGLINEGEKKWNDDYLPKIKETAERYFKNTYNK